MSDQKRVAVVGGGWAGLAAAVSLIERGCAVTLFEASRRIGGRARHVDWVAPGGNTIALDNGQHILIGAYQHTLGLMRQLGVPVDEVLLRLPLTVQNTAGFALSAGRLPAPLHLLGALLTARGLSMSERMEAIRLMRTAKKNNWKLASDSSVTKWLLLHQQSVRLRAWLWEPLCLAALNTPPAQASAQVFLNVLRDSVGAARSDSDLLLPRRNLSALLPDAALRHIRSRGTIKLAQRVTALLPVANGIRITSAEETNEDFDAAVLAVSAHHVPALLHPFVETTATQQPGFNKLMQQCRDFSWQPITTVYLQYAATPFTAQQAPMLMLHEDPAQQYFGQWVFDRERLSNDEGLVAVVISADGPHRQLDANQLIAAVSRQLQGQMKLTAQPIAAQVLTEKRATFACVPGLSRPTNNTPEPRLFLAGDYTASDAMSAYPATLETAVRSGIEAAELWSRRNR